MATLGRPGCQGYSDPTPKSEDVAAYNRGAFRDVPNKPTVMDITSTPSTSNLMIFRLGRTVEIWTSTLSPRTKVHCVMKIMAEINRNFQKEQNQLPHLRRPALSVPVAEDATTAKSAVKSQSLPTKPRMSAEVKKALADSGTAIFMSLPAPDLRKRASFEDLFEHIRRTAPEKIANIQQSGLSFLAVQYQNTKARDAAKKLLDISDTLPQRESPTSSSRACLSSRFSIRTLKPGTQRRSCWTKLSLGIRTGRLSS